MSTRLAEHARDTALAAQEHHADPRLLLAVDATIERWAASGRRFSANEIRDEVPTLAADLVGGRVRAALLRKELVKVGEVKSSLRSTHAKKIGVYVGAAFAAEVAA